MYTKPICENGAREPLFWYEVKKVWLKVKYLPKYNSISKREFFTNFLEYCEMVGIEWGFKDKQGKLKVPTEKDYNYAATKCFKKYKWDDCFDQYETDRMTESQKRVLKNYNKRIETKVMKNEEQYDRIDSNIDNLLSEQEDLGAHHEYRIAKDIESKNQLDEKSRQLLGLDKETEDTTSEVIPVSDNPEHEMEAINDKWDELMWKEIGEDRPW